MNFIIDCDPGVDDAQAILLALSSSKLDVRAICSVSGNGDIDNTTRNARSIALLAGRPDIDVYRGSSVALGGYVPDTVDAFGNDGLGGASHLLDYDENIKGDAIDALLRLSNDLEDLTIFALGPLTNIARCVLEDESFASRIHTLVIMGGSLSGGNMSPVSEYNFWADPLAAKIVFEAGFNHIQMYGLNVTKKIALTTEEHQLLRLINTPISHFLYEAMFDGLDENWESEKLMRIPMHDVITIANYLNPSICELTKAYVEIATDEPCRGMSVVDIGGKWHEGKCNAEVATSVDVSAFKSFFFETLFSVNPAKCW